MWAKFALLTFSQTVLSFNHLPHNPDFNPEKDALFENIAGKGENAGDLHFLLFPQCFLPIQKQISRVMFTLLSANTFSLDEFKILLFGKELLNLP